MFVIEASNVRDALPKAIQYIVNNGELEESRIGQAWVAPGPVTIHYRFPKQHVLLNPFRNANPFFHLMEAMWMLAGRDDGEYLDHYIKDFSIKFGSSGLIMDAYGQRWRDALRYDQLNEIVNQLRKEPFTRQAVLQMWGAGRDDLRADHFKPCNLVAVFRIRHGALNMTVYNRSNDLIWGCCGANAVHFPILQEYLAGRIGVYLGEYWQVSNNLHLYIDHIKCGYDHYFKDPEPYGHTLPLTEYPHVFDAELSEVMAMIDLIHRDTDFTEVYTGNISSVFLRDVVVPMAIAHREYKLGNKARALENMAGVKADDWKQAGTEWLERHNGK